MSTFYQDSLEPQRPASRSTSRSLRLLAKLPTIAAYAYKKSIGQPFVYPRNDLTYCENFLRMMFAVPTRAVRGRPGFRRRAQPAADRARRSRAELQHVDGADGRLVGRESVRVDLGRHLRLVGPAARRGQRGLRRNAASRSADDGGNVKKYVDMAKDKDNNFRLMGFGHRVYKNFDPRATIIKAACDKLLAKRHINDPIFDIAKQLEEVALNDPYFIERKLYPNVDFYSGVIYRAIGIPVQMFTVLFAMGRLPGWIAHWLEMHTQPDQEDLPPAADLHRARRNGRSCRWTSGSNGVDARSATASEAAAVPLVQTDSLSKRYGRLAALSDCSFGVERGEILGLLGPNGAGKTTLLRLLLGYLKPTAGRATIDGLDCYRQSVDVHRRLAYLPGEARLFRQLNGRETLSCFRRLRDAAPLERALQLAERLQLDLTRRVRQMSTGMRQKLALAIALTPDVPLVILDEPTANLDPTVRRDVVELIREARAPGQDGVLLLARAVGSRRRVRPRARAPRRAAGRLGPRRRRPPAAPHHAPS